MIMKNPPHPGLNGSARLPRAAGSDRYRGGQGARRNAAGARPINSNQRSPLFDFARFYKVRTSPVLAWPWPQWFPIGRWPEPYSREA